MSDAAVLLWFNSSFVERQNKIEKSINYVQVNTDSRLPIYSRGQPSFCNNVKPTQSNGNSTKTNHLFDC